jgi:ABC-type phosphate transport system permease subunit
MVAAPAVQEGSAGHAVMAFVIEMIAIVLGVIAAAWLLNYFPSLAPG